jgi:hypothetical protein
MSYSNPDAAARLPEVQEQYFVWNKLLSAVQKESLHELRRALEHAKNVGIDKSSEAILFTLCDALTRHCQRSTEDLKSEVMDAVEREDWSHALESAVDLSIESGADRSLLLNMLTKLVTDLNEFAQSPRSSSGQRALSTQEVQLEVYDNTGKHKKRHNGTRFEGGLVGTLKGLAAEHAKQELDKAWTAVDKLYSNENAVGGGSVGGFGPGYTAFSQEEEHFFIRNQISTAIRQERLVDLRRAIAYCLSLGVNPKSIEIEAGYRDALIRHQLGDGFSPQLVFEALERDDWWVVLDMIIGASFARGIDRHSALCVIAKVCSGTADKSPPPNFSAPATIAPAIMRESSI